MESRFERGDTGVRRISQEGQVRSSENQSGQ